MAGGEVHKRRMSQSSGSTIIDPDVEQQDVSPPCSPRGRPSTSDPRTSLRHLLATHSSSPPSQPSHSVPAKRRRSNDKAAAAARHDAGGRGSSHPSASSSTSPSSSPSHGRQRNMLASAARSRKRSPSAEGEGPDGENGSGRGNSRGNAPPPSATWTPPVVTKPGNNNNTTTTATSTTRRAVHNMTTSSVFAGNKMKHIKKEDGMPLWRRDIQYDFLRAVFEDRNAVFTNFHENRRGCTFSDIYVDSMARSSKTSKILRDKLLSDRAAANNMAMVCLLVNVGRMNTTLNFFPEMRAQLRTYHAIPCLQAHQDSSAYKQLQDAPRLKSILKGACEDQNEPNSFEKLRELGVPRTNPVNLIFLLSQYAPKLSDVHFSPQLDFFDLFTRCTLSSRSRARAFLWLMWWYLESDFSREAALANPFGAGQLPETDGVPQKVPAFEHLTEAQAALENNDTSEELEFGMRKQEERQHILEMESAIAAPSSRRAKRGSLRGPTRTRIRKRSTMDANHSDSDRTRSVSPSGTHGAADAVNPRASLSVHGGLILPDDQHAESSPLSRRTPRARPERDRGDRRTGQRPLLSNAEQLRDQSSPAPSLPGATTTAAAAYTDGNTGGGGGSGVGGGTLLPLPLSLSRRARPTAHQLALTHSRKERVTRLLRQRRLHEYRRLRRARQRDGPIIRAWRRHEAMEDPFENSEDDDAGSGTAAAAAMMAGAGAGGSGRGYAAVAVATAAAAAAAVAAAGGGGSGGHHHHYYHYHHHSSSGANRDTNGPFRERGLGGLIPLDSEDDDYGEEVAAYAAALRRTSRRLNRWDALDEAVASGRYVVQQEEEGAAAAGSVVGGVGSFGNGGGGGGPRAAMTNGSLKHHRAHRHHVNDEDDDDDMDIINHNGYSHNANLATSTNTNNNGSYTRAAPDEEDDDGELDDMDRELLGEAPPAAPTTLRSSGSGGGGRGGSRGGAPPPPPPSGPSWGVFDGPRATTTATELPSLPFAPTPLPPPRI